MKTRYIFIALLIIVIVSCCSRERIGRDRLIGGLIPDFTNTNVSPEEAQNAVLSMLKDMGEEATKSSNRTVRDIWSTGRVDTKSGNENYPLFYVINFSDNKGFAIAGADKRVPPVVFIAEEGSLNSGDTLKNPGMVAMLSKIETETRMLLGLPVEGIGGRVWEAGAYRPFIDLGIGRGINYDPDSCDVYWTLSQTYTPVGTQVGCHWDQRSPFNAYCPIVDSVHAPVGCVPIAVAQVMYYHKKNATYDGMYYNWDLMQYVVNANSSATNNAWYKVKSLLVDLGDSNNLNVTYGKTSSGANTGNALRTFENFGYLSGGSYDDYSYSTLASEISSDYPVIARGRRLSDRVYSAGIQVDSIKSGHAWVIDQTMRSLWRVWIVHRRTNQLVYSTMVYRNYVHCNWGWGGESDGFFLSEVFDKNDSLAILDTKTILDTIPTYDYFYQYDKKLVTGIRP